MYLWKKAPASCTIWTSLSPRLQSKLLPHSTRTEELGCLNSLGASWPLRSASTAANGFSERSSGEKDPCQTCSSTVGLHCRLEPDCNREATLLRANMHCQQHPCHCWQRAIFHAGNSSHPREKHSLSAAQICCVWAVLNHHFRQRSVTVSTGTCTTSTGNDTSKPPLKPRNACGQVAVGGFGGTAPTFRNQLTSVALRIATLLGSVRLRTHAEKLHAGWSGANSRPGRP